MATVGLCFPRHFAARDIVEIAQRLDEGGGDDLWIIEDCFFTSSVPLAAAALTATDRISVGLGILPAPGRTAAITAMELATLHELGNGRLLAGIGHGVQEWMHQMGVRPRSPLTALDEVVTNVRALLHGETVDVEGEYVTLRSVTLERPPAEPPPVLAGVRGPKSLALAGRVADGVVLAECSGPNHLVEAAEFSGRTSVGHGGDFTVAVFAVTHVADTREEAAAAMAPWLAGMVVDPNPGLEAAWSYESIRHRYETDGVEGLATMPHEWWNEVAAVGTASDVLQHAEALAAAGATHVAFFPTPEPAVYRDQLRRLQASVFPHWH